MTSQHVGPDPPARSGCRGILGTGVGVLFFGVFLVAGLLFAAMLLREAWYDVETWWWPSAPCRILAAEVADSGGDDEPYEATVRFEYVQDGDTFVGNRLRRRPVTSSSWAKMADRIQRYPVGRETTCLVDPDDPAVAVLERSAPWSLAMLPLPLVFVAVGGFGVFAVVRRRGSTPGRQAPISGGAGRARKAAWIPVVLGLVFTFVGGGLFVALGVVPVARLVDAREWLPTPCTVISSSVRSHASDDGTTYSIDIVYEYETAGRTWRSNRYDFVGGSSSGHSGKRAVVDRYPEGSTATCFVDPDDPSQAVLNREPSVRYLVGLFPLLFLLPGLGVLWFGIRMRRREPRMFGTSGSNVENTAFAAAPATVTIPTDVTADPDAPLDLEPQVGPAAKVAGAGCAAVFWNGIVGIFVWQAVAGWRRGRPDWFLTLFLVPFVLVGLVLIGSIVYFALATVNPRPRLRITPGSPRVGGRLRVEWTFSGRVARIRHLGIRLVGQEKATYRRGTDTVTDTEEFARLHVLSSELAPEIRSGSREVEIPSGTMHSLDAPNNDIEWSLEVSGDISRWPDVSESFPVHVRPPSAGEGR